MKAKKRRDYKKHHRGGQGSTTKGTEVVFGSHGLASLQSGELRENVYKAVMQTLRKHLKDSGKIYGRVSMDYSITKKPLHMKMGGGKGKFDHYSSFVKRGKILLEIDGVEEERALRLLRIAQSKLPFKTVVMFNRI